LVVFKGGNGFSTEAVEMTEMAMEISKMAKEKAKWR